MALDVNPDIASSFEQSKDSDGALTQLRQAFLFETQQQLTGLAQLTNRDAHLDFFQRPAESESSLGTDAQMFGRAAADAIPVIVTGLAMRAGFGKLLPKGVETANSILLRRTPIGLSSAESAATGFVTGSLLKPSDEDARQSLTSLVGDRFKSGTVSALSFGILSGVNSEAALLSERFGSPLVKAAFANPVSAGILSGIPGGIFNAELDSVANKGNLTLDPTKIGQSIYEMSIVGGAFGAAGLVAGRISGARSANDFLGDKRTLALETDSARTSDDAAQFEPKFNIFTAPRAKPSSVSKFLSNIPNPADWLNLDFGPQPAFAGMGAINQSAFEITPFPKISLANAAYKVEHQSEKANVWGGATAEPVVEKPADAPPTLRSSVTSDGATLAIGSPDTRFFSLGKDAAQRLTSIEEVDLDTIEDFVNRRGEAGKKTLVKLIDAGAHSQHLTEPGLSDFAKLDTVWNPSVETTKNLLDRGAKVLEQVPGLDRYVEADPIARSAELEQLVNGKAPLRHLDADRLESLRSLEKTFADTPQVIPKLLRAEHQLDLSWLEDHLRTTEDSGAIDRVVRLANKSPDSPLLNTASLNGLAHFSKHFEHAPEVMERIETMSPPMLTQLEQYLSTDVKGPRTSTIRQLVSQGASDDLFAPDRLIGIEKIIKATGKFDELKTRILNAESKGLNLKVVGDFLSHVAPADMHKAASVLDHVIEHEPLAKLDSDYLAARYEFTDSKRIRPDLANKLLDLSSKGLNLGEVHNFIFKRGGPGDFRASIVEGQLNRNTEPRKLTLDRLRAIDRLYDVFNQQSVAKLLDLETPRVPITQISEFAMEGDENVRKLNSFLKESGRHNELNLQQLADSSNLSKLEAYFPKESETYKHLAELQSKSLSSLRLANFIAEDPASRMALVDMLAEDRADTPTFDTHMKLSVLPDSIAYDVVEAIESGDINLRSLLGNMRSFEHGRTFTDLLTSHVRSSGEITQNALDDLSDRAIKEAKTAQQVGKESGALIDRQTRSVNAFDEDGLRETHLRPDNLRVDEKLRTSSEALSQTAERIDKFIPPDKTIVLLGRDTWPMVPLLKARGRDVQYFMWTRLQNEDQPTMNQWLKEVPPNSAVVDTGFMGTIFDAIGKIDPSATGYLMNSLSHYKQLLPFSTSEKVMTIEDIPKMIGRSTGYTESGNAISRQKHRDDGDRESSFASRNQRRWQVQQETEKLLRQLGLPEWDVWRYRDYVGLTPGERLGYDKNEDVLAHYERIARERAKPGIANDTPSATTANQPVP